MFNFRCKKQTIGADKVELIFNTVGRLIKDLPKADYDRLKEAMDLYWKACQKAKNVKTAEERAIEKEYKDINESEKKLEFIELDGGQNG